MTKLSAESDVVVLNRCRLGPYILWRGLEELVPHRRGSFHEDWNDLLTRFANRRRHDQQREQLLQRANEEALQSELCEPVDPHQALFERAHGD